jgi:putative ABC transport system ATP-binding protein
MIEIQDVHKYYGEHHVNALRGVSFRLEAGEFVALMGPSGCGKSTLLNVIGTLDHPNSGHVLLDGVSLLSQDDATLTRFRRERVGFIFQFFNLLSTLTVAENVALPLELDPTISEKAAREAVAVMLERVGMSHRAAFYPAQLSGGEMQRVAIARALIHKPSIILADEPTGNLDTENGEALLTLLRDIARTERPIILMATHSEEAARSASRILRMRDGLCVADEPVAYA